MSYKYLSRLGALIIIFLLSACSSPPQSTPPALNTLPPTWTQTPISNRTTSLPTATRTSASTSTNEADLDATFDVFQLTNATPSNTPTLNRVQLTNIANTNLLRTPSPTSTQGPRLRAHSWLPEPVLVEMWLGGGDGCCLFDFPPDIILYSNGQLVLSGEIDSFTYKPLTRTLDRKTSCQFLNTIDQSGFFDYDPSIYRSPYDGGGSTRISVNTWRSKVAQHTDLFIFILGNEFEKVLNCPNCAPPPIIQSALSDTYKLLYSYNPGGMKYYEPEKLIVWLSETSYRYTLSKPWPLTSLSLQDVAQQSSFGDDFIIIEGDVVSDWYEQVPSGLYWEGGLEIEVLSRPMWPFEKETNRDFYGSSIPSNEYPIPTEPLECKVIDGVLPIP